MYQLSRQIMGTICLPESGDLRVIQGGIAALKTGVCSRILVGDQVLKLKEALDISPYLENGSFQIQANLDLEAACEALNNGSVQGVICGAQTSTSDVLRSAIRRIGLRPGITRLSSFFWLRRGPKALIFSDCAVQEKPTTQNLVEIAEESVKHAKLLLDEPPRVAFLSYSTHGSARSQDCQKMAEAAQMFRQKFPDVVCDGELQFDSAYNPEISLRKCPQSRLAGTANVFIFPNIESGNIGYKICQEMGGFQAVGPCLQGLRLPVNDLSRGCTAADVETIIEVTMKQAKLNLN